MIIKDPTNMGTHPIAVVNKRSMVVRGVCTAMSTPHSTASKREGRSTSSDYLLSLRVVRTVTQLQKP